MGTILACLGVLYLVLGFWSGALILLDYHRTPKAYRALGWPSAVFVTAAFSVAAPAIFVYFMLRDEGLYP